MMLIDVIKIQRMGKHFGVRRIGDAVITQESEFRQTWDGQSPEIQKVSVIVRVDVDTCVSL
jgi:hypothetical protein